MQTSEHFRYVGDLDVAPLLGALEALPDAYADGAWRAETRRSPHRDSNTLVLRGPPTTKPRDILNSLDVVETEAFQATKVFQDAVYAIANMAGKPPARAMVVSLKAGGKVARHVDTGDYAEATERYHLPLLTNDGAWLEVDGDRRVLPTGKVVWFDKHAEHEGSNDGQTARVHLIVDLFA